MTGRSPTPLKGQAARAAVGGMTHFAAADTVCRMNRDVFLRPLIALFALACVFPLTPANAQLPPDTKSDLGPDVPAFRVRPGYRVTRALPPKVSQVKDARFLEFSGDGKTLFL